MAARISPFELGRLLQTSQQHPFDLQKSQQLNVLRSVDLVDYRIFVQLARCLHFGRTARTVGMSASALTRRVQAMEEELGQQLLIRDHREIQITAAGGRFRAFAQLHLEQWETLKSDLREEASAPTGTLHIACTVTAAHTVLPRLLSTYRQRYPGVTLRLITQDATRSLNQLEAGEVDLAVIPTDGEAPDNLASTVLGETDFAIIAPCDLDTWKLALAKTPPQMNEIPFVAPIGGLERKRLDEWFKNRKQEAQIVAEVRGNEGIIAMVSLGAGLGLVPRLVLENSPLKHNVRELCELETPPGYQVSLCTRRPNLSRRIIQLFWQLSEEGVSA